MDNVKLAIQEFVEKYKDRQIDAVALGALSNRLASLTCVSPMDWIELFNTILKGD